MRSLWSPNEAKSRTHTSGKDLEDAHLSFVALSKIFVWGGIKFILHRNQRGCFPTWPVPLVVTKRTLEESVGWPRPGSPREHCGEQKKSHFRASDEDGMKNVDKGRR